MKFGLLTAGVVLAASLSLGVMTYHHTAAPLLKAEQTGDTMSWLHQEFKLSDAQYQQIARLHQAYGTTCAQHCQDIQQADQELEAAENARPLDPQKIKLAEARLQRVKSVCEQSMEAQVRKVADSMPETEGRRYLAMVLSRIGHYDHSGPPDLRLQRP